MKSTFLLLAPIALATTTAAPETELTFDPDEGTVLTRLFEASLEMEMVSYGVSLDEEELPVRELEYSITWTETVEVEDELVEIEDGRPTELVRTFTTLKQESTAEFDGEEKERISMSDLEGRVLRFEWDDDAEYYTIESDDDGDELDDEILEWLEEDMDLRALLPEDEVDIGESWEIDEAVYLPLMWPGGLVGWYEEGEEEGSEMGRELNRETIENLTAEGEATLDDIRDEDGTRVAVITIELDIETGGDFIEEDVNENDVEHTVDISRQLSGEILWDLENNHLYAVDLSADIVKIVGRTSVIVADDEHDLVEEERYEGELTYVVTIDRE